MKKRIIVAAIASLSLLASAHRGVAQTTAFTYQGRLGDNGVPANGTYDFQFTLSIPAGPPDTFFLVRGPRIAEDVAVSNGLFTTEVDFGTGAFQGTDLYLGISVRAGASTGAFSLLSPLHRITSAPYAIFSANASQAASAGTANAVAPNAVGNVGLQNSSVNSSKIADGSITASDLSLSLLNDTFWRLDGNGGTTAGTHFLGTTDNQAFELKVNGTRALRLEPNTNGAPNVIGGSPNNLVGASVVGATIGGGGALNYFGMAYTNRVEGHFGTISGGRGNTIQTSDSATIGGGVENTIQIGANWATIGGGIQNTIQPGAAFATIGGGVENTIQRGADNAIISGGYFNIIQTNSDSATIGGGLFNTIQTNSDSATIGGGSVNTIQTNSHEATIGGGLFNTIQTSSDFATIPGGRANSATNYAFAAGRRAKANHTGAFVWADSTDADFASSLSNQFNVRASGGVRFSDDTPALSFGSSTRQMINLFGKEYAIGVQSGATYFRTASRFSWFRGGGHKNGADDPGAGGSILMSLDTSGLTVNGTFVSASDRNTKENFRRVDPRAVLEKVAQLAITEWNYKEDQSSRHIGPVAQDFHAAFNVGPDDKHITMVDADGVALAAIQGLNQKVEEREASLREELQRRDAENAELKRRLEALEKLIHHQKSN